MSSAATPLNRPATLADLLVAEEDGDHSFELIDGELAEKQAGFRHNRAQVQLSRVIGPFDDDEGDGPGGWWILTEQLVRLAPDRVLKPDLAGWRRDRLPEPSPEEDGVIDVCPDWVCEIISPTHAARDLVRKKRMYHQAQVPHYWVIDPRDSTLTVHRWSAVGYTEVLAAQAGDVIRAEPFGDVELNVGALFVPAKR